MADRRPLTTPGRIVEIPSGDRLEVEGIVRTVAGDLTFSDPVTGTKTLAQLAAGGGGGSIGGSTGGNDDRLIRSDGTGGSTIQASPVSLTDAGAMSGITDITMAGTLAITGNISVSGTVDGVDVSTLASTVATHVAGPLGTDDDRIVRTNGIGQYTAQGSAVTLTDAGVMSGLTGVSVTGNITVSGTVDGRDVSADWSTTSGHIADALIHLPALGSSLQVLRVNAGATAPEWATVSVGSGDVVGPAGATDNALARFDLTTGKLIQNSGVMLDDSKNLSGIVGITMTGNITMAPGATVDGVDVSALDVASSAHITGPGSSTDNAVVRYDGATGKLAKNSGVLIDGSNNVTGVAGLTTSGTITMGSSQSIAMNNSVLTNQGYTTITPTPVGSSQNDYSPTGWSSADIVRITLGGDQTITGFSATATSLHKWIVNADATDILLLPNESASSSANNRILTPNGQTMYLLPGAAIRIIYDPTSSRWRAIGQIASLPPNQMLHMVRRSAQLTNITTTVFPAYDTTMSAINAGYWTYASGVWTCNRAHTAVFRTVASYQINAGAVQGEALVQHVQGTGGVFTNILQEHSDSAYSTTSRLGHLTCSSIRAWAVNEQMRIQYSTTAGAIDILAARNTCEVIWVGG